MPAGPVALITGGTDGIGRACALRLAAQGTALILVGRNENKGQQALDDIRAAVAGANVTFLPYDLALMRSVSDLADTVLTHYPDLNLVVQCAGAMRARRTMTSASSMISTCETTRRTRSRVQPIFAIGNSASDESS